MCQLKLYTSVQIFMYISVGDYVKWLCLLDSTSKLELLSFVVGRQINLSVQNYASVFCRTLFSRLCSVLIFAGIGRSLPMYWPRMTRTALTLMSLGELYSPCHRRFFGHLWSSAGRDCYVVSLDKHKVWVYAQLWPDKTQYKINE